MAFCWKNPRCSLQENHAGDCHVVSRDTQPRTLSGIPRVEGVAPETPQQDVRNALAILQAKFEIGHPCIESDFDGACGHGVVSLDADEYTAVMLRLETAVNKLEGRTP